MPTDARSKVPLSPAPAAPSAANVPPAPPSPTRRAVAACLTLSALLALAAAALAPPPAHILVLDAGSSGTRVHVYAVTPPPRAGALPAVREATRARVPRRSGPSTRSPLDRVETTPGLAAAVSAASPNTPAAVQAAVDAALAPLLTHAAAAVPPAQHSHTPILLAATGGVRKLAPADRDALLAAVAAALAASPFSVARPPRALAGADEAAHAWAAVNYVRGSLAGGGSTTAVADLGGATLEVAAAVDGGGAAASSAARRVVVVGDVTHTLDAASYAGAGLDDAYAAVVDAGSRACAPPVENYAACAAAADAAAANVTALPPATAVAPVSGFAVAAARVGAPAGAPITAHALDAATAAACSSARASHRACFGGAYAAALLRALAPSSTMRPPRHSGWPLGAALMDGLPAVELRPGDDGAQRRRARAGLWAGAVAAAAAGGGVAAGRLARRRRAARD